MGSLARDPVIGPFVPELENRTAARNQSIFQRNKKGIDLARALDGLPAVRPSSIDTENDRIRIGCADDLDWHQGKALFRTLQALKPWRKGPFEIFGLDLDSEWNSALKWNRLADHLEPQTGKRVLDIGSSCGYYMFRLAAQHPALVIGIEPYLIAASLNGILAQRLVRRICPDCKENFEAPENLRKYLDMAQIEPHELMHGRGCDTCRNSGYSGRCGIHELLGVDEEFRRIINSDSSVNSMRKAFHESGWPTLFQDGLQKVKQGITTIEEVLRVAEVADAVDTEMPADDQQPVEAYAGQENEYN